MFFILFFVQFSSVSPSPCAKKTTHGSARPTNTVCCMLTIANRLLQELSDCRAHPNLESFSLGLLQDCCTIAAEYGPKRPRATPTHFSPFSSRQRPRMNRHPCSFVFLRGLCLPVLPLRTPSDDDDEGNSDDEGRIKATRERLRERRKHRNRTRHHPQPQPHTPRSLSHDRGGPEAPLPSRPRAKSAASMVPLRPHSVPEDSLPGKRGIGGAGLERKRGKSAAGVVERKRGNAGSAGGGAADADRNAKGLSSGGGSVLVTPVPSLTGWLFSFAAVPWYLLAIVFLVEALEYSRFSSETAGFLEAAEAALTVLGAGIDGQGGGGGTERGGAAAAVSGTTVVLKEELARGLMRIYSRNRFLWPFSSFVQ